MPQELRHAWRLCWRRAGQTGRQQVEDASHLQIVRQHGQVVALAHDVRLAQLDPVIALRNLAAGMRRPVLRRAVPMAVERAVVDALGFEEDRRVVVLDRRDQQPLGVIGRRRDHRLQSRNMREDALGRLRMRLPPEDAAAERRSYGDRRGELLP